MASVRALGVVAMAVIGAASALGVHYEGKRLTAYADVGGIPTICYGHTKGVQPGDTATDAQCEAWLRQDMAQALEGVRRCVGRQMPFQVEVAFSDMYYNVGPGKIGVKDGFCVLKDGRYSTIRRLAMQGRWAEACNQLPLWRSGGGQQLPGLVARRETERAICMGEAQ